MSVEIQAEFTNDTFRQAAEVYQSDPASVTLEQYIARMTACDKCSMMRRGTCLANGCSIISLARRKDKNCPHFLKFWPEILNS